MDNAFQIDGEVLCIDDTRPAKEGSSMMLRDFIIKKPNAGEANDLKFQCKGNNCPLLDKFEIGDKVIVTFSLTGSFGGAANKEGNIKSAKNQFGLSTFSPNLNCYEIRLVPGFVREVNSNQHQPNPNQSQKENQPAAPQTDDLPF